MMTTKMTMPKRSASVGRKKKRYVANKPPVVVITRQRAVLKTTTVMMMIPMTLVRSLSTGKRRKLKETNMTRNTTPTSTRMMTLILTITERNSKEETYTVLDLSSMVDHPNMEVASLKDMDSSSLDDLNMGVSQDGTMMMCDEEADMVAMENTEVATAAEDEMMTVTDGEVDTTVEEEMMMMMTTMKDVVGTSKHTEAAVNLASRNTVDKPNMVASSSMEDSSSTVVSSNMAASNRMDLVNMTTKSEEKDGIMAAVATTRTTIIVEVKVMVADTRCRQTLMRIFRQC